MKTLVYLCDHSGPVAVVRGSTKAQAVNAALGLLHRLSPYSWDYSFRWSGWSILDEKGREIPMLDPPPKKALAKDGAPVI